MRKLIADRMGLIDASGIRKVFALGASLKDPINFSIGLPDFDVPDPIKAAAIEAIQQGQNRYSQTVGLGALIDKVRERVRAQTPWDDPKVLITSGASGALLLAFMAVIEPGDEVILPDPYFVIYKHVVRLLGGRCVYIDTYPDFGLPVDKIAAAVTDRTKMVILNSPANPTGAVYRESDLRDLAEALDGTGILVMSDEIYDHFCYDGPCASITDHYEDTLLVKGFSKSYAMTGWRMGYVAAASEPVKRVIEEMTKLQQYTFVCAPTPFQVAAQTALDMDVSEYIAAYRRKRDLAVGGLKDHFELGYEPAGAFYLFVKAPDNVPDATTFVTRAIEHNVLIIPGCVFSEKDTHFRMCYTTTDEKIRQGVEILCGLAGS